MPRNMELKEAMKWISSEGVEVPGANTSIKTAAVRARLNRTNAMVEMRSLIESTGRDGPSYTVTFMIHDHGEIILRIVKKFRTENSFIQFLETDKAVKVSASGKKLALTVMNGVDIRVPVDGWKVVR